MNYLLKIIDKVHDYPCPYGIGGTAWGEIRKCIEKQIPENHFNNECNCVVDYETLYQAIDNKCRSNNCYLHNAYRIVLKNKYPAVCINRRWFYVHVLVGEIIYGKIRKGYVIHHKDKNKLNATRDNLELMTPSQHSRLHGNDNRGTDFRSAEGKEKSLNAAMDVRTRKDVTVENVTKLRDKGLRVSEIAKELNCGVNTVYRRLGVKA